MDKIAELEERLKQIEEDVDYLLNKDNPMEDVGDTRIVRGDWY